jgi:phosphoribosylglycinamide formyltransferase 1
VKKLVVLASGSGSNFQAIIDAIAQGDVKAHIAGLIAGKPGIGAVEKARKYDIPVVVLDNPPGPDHSRRLLDYLNRWNPDLIILAGYLRKIPDDVVEAYKNRIINIHPSLLPRYGGKGFYGEHVHRAVLEAGDTESGCTVHYVNELYDEGDIIRQVTVPVLAEDTPETLAKRVLAEEHKLLPSVIAELLTSNPS